MHTHPSQDTHIWIHTHTHMHIHIDILEILNTCTSHSSSSLQDSFLSSHIPYYALSSIVRMLVADNTNVFTHLLNPVIHLKKLQTCSTHTTIENKTSKKSSGQDLFSIPIFTAGLKVYTQILGS